MSARRALRRRAVPLLLLLTTAAMAFCARAPSDGAGWRTAFVLTAFSGFLLLAAAWRWGGYRAWTVLGTALALRLLVFPLLPVLSDDGYRYVWDGLVQVEVGVNPYRFTPSDPALAPLQDAPLYDTLNSAGYYSVYPPLSQLCFALGALAGSLGWIAIWYLIKLLLVTAEVGGLWLLRRMITPRLLLLYAWNPLVVLETAGQGHTEALAVGLIVSCVYAARKGRGGLSAAALAGAGWVKLFPFLLLPLVVRRFGARAALAGAVVIVLLALPYAAPYVPGHFASSLRLYVRLFEFNAGPYLAMKGLLGLWTGEDWSKTLGPALLVPFFLSLALVYVLDLKRALPLAGIMSIILGLFFATATTVHPWYLVPSLALVPLTSGSAAGRWWGAAWLWLSACAMATYWRYAGPTWGYAVAVAAGWSGWALLTGRAAFEVGLPTLMRARARRSSPPSGPCSAARVRAPRSP